MTKYGQTRDNNKNWTDEEVMLKDAKEYAKRDYHVFTSMCEAMGIEYDKAEAPKILIQIKLDKIKNARFNRVSDFD